MLRPAIARSIVPPRVGVPDISFGPYRLLESVPWLIFATGLRMQLHHPVFGFAFFHASQIAMCMALLLGARRMIELTEGRTGLGALQFGEQIGFSRAIVGRIYLVLFGLTLLSAVAAAFLRLPFEKIAPMSAFDGIAFDQFHDIGRLWTAIMSAFVILLVIEKGEGREPGLSGLASQFARHWLYILAAIASVTVFLMLFTHVQDHFRQIVRDIQTWPWPRPARNLTAMTFIFGFATIRMWVVLAIFCLFLRWSYREGA